MFETMGDVGAPCGSSLLKQQICARTVAALGAMLYGRAMQHSPDSSKVYRREEVLQIDVQNIFAFSMRLCICQHATLARKTMGRGLRLKNLLQHMVQLELNDLKPVGGRADYSKSARPFWDLKLLVSLTRRRPIQVVRQCCIWNFQKRSNISLRVSCQEPLAGSHGEALSCTCIAGCNARSPFNFCLLAKWAKVPPGIPVNTKVN